MFERMNQELEEINQRFYSDEIDFDEMLDLQADVYDQHNFDPDED